IPSSFSYSNIIGLIAFTIILIFIIPLVIYFNKRLLYKKNYKFVYTPIDSIERRSNISYEEFVREYASVGKPVIITDVVKNWRASTKWNLDFFKSKYGSVKLEVQDYNPEGEFTRETRTHESMKIADYIDYMTGGAGNKLLYLSNMHICYHPELWEDCEDPIYFNNWFKRFPLELIKRFYPDFSSVFIGFKDTSVGLHYDSRHDTTWVAVISGRKQVVMFPPDQEKYLYEGRVNCFKPNFKKFPLYAQAKSVQFILDQGEILYMPSNWWHQLKNLENTIAVATGTLHEWDYELVCQGFLDKAPIKGHLFPLILEFPWLGRTLSAVGLLER
ncbi:MAG: cupin-like domain-containing protein, partial [Rhizonema sp. PD37]|nr:cupin-like domain-containing protein [Rhizonema sp. PD37]